MSNTRRGGGLAGSTSASLLGAVTTWMGLTAFRCATFFGRQGMFLSPQCGCRREVQTDVGAILRKRLSTRNYCLIFVCGSLKTSMLVECVLFCFDIRDMLNSDPCS